MKEDIKTYYLAGKGAAQGAYNYYIKPSVKDNPAIIGAVAVALVLGSTIKGILSDSKAE